MISPISNATPIQPVAQSKTTSAKQAPPQSADSVTLSATAQAHIAALQEANETPAQTAQEASRGDMQARRLLAEESAANPVSK